MVVFRDSSVDQDGSDDSHSESGPDIPLEKDYIDLQCLREIGDIAAASSRNHARLGLVEAQKSWDLWNQKVRCIRSFSIHEIYLTPCSCNTVYGDLRRIGSRALSKATIWWSDAGG